MKDIEDSVSWDTAKQLRIEAQENIMKSDRLNQELEAIEKKIQEEISKEVGWGLMIRGQAR